MNSANAQSPSPERQSLTALKRRIALLERATAFHPVVEAGTVGAGAAIDWGISAIDRHLPAGGLELGALHEFAGAELGTDLEEAGLAAGITVRLLARVQSRRPGHVLWVARQRDLYARALPATGCDPERLLHLVTRRNDDTLWAIEEALRVPGLAALVGEVGPLDLTQSRRLQLAAEKSGVPAFIIRRGRSATQVRSWLTQPSAAQTRWRIHPAPSIAQQQTLPGPTRWRLELWRCRGGRTGSWLIEETDHGWREAALSLPLSAALADRPLVAPVPQPASGDSQHRRKTG